MFEKSKPFTIQYEYELQSEVPYKELNVRMGSNEPHIKVELTKKYISPAKPYQRLKR